MSGLTRGLQNLAGSAQRIVARERDRQNVIDFAAADAAMTRGYLNMGNDFERDDDYLTFGDRAEERSHAILTEAGALIRDERARAQWLAANEVQRLRQVDAIGDIGRSKELAADKALFEASLTDYSRMITEPGTPADMRNNARVTLDATIAVARENGLITESEEFQYRRTYIDQAEQTLARNELDLLVRTNAQEAARIAGEAIGVGVDGNPLGRQPPRLPVVVAPGSSANLGDADPVSLSRYEQVQEAFGKQVPVISAARGDAHNDAVGGASNSQHLAKNGATALDLDVSGLSKDERLRLIETASAMGFTGIGVYANSIHLDMRQSGRAAWGPSHGNESIPAWARETMDRHTGGRIAQVPTAANPGRDPRFAALDYADMAKAYDQAKSELDRGDMAMRAAIEVTAENAPFAISATGEYTGFMPTANDFVAAFGATEGLQKAEQFNAAVGVAQDTFAMRTMSNDEIMAMVETATPTSSGDDAALQAERHALLTQAAAATIKARDDDPAGYVMNTFPVVAEAWDAVNNDDPATFANAVTATALAQEQLGFDELRLLPKAFATNTATMFNSTEISDQERIGALQSAVLATPNVEHQKAILDQLIDAGVPESTRFALDALIDRSDPGAATRLMQAAMASPEVLGKPLPGDMKSNQVEEIVADRVFDLNQIGDVYFDLTYGSVSNFEQAQSAQALMNNSVKLRLLDGSAGGNVQTAIDMTVRDMFGDVKVVTGKSWGGGAGIKVTLPTDADEGMYRSGFDSLLGRVGEAMAADIRRDGQVGQAPTDGAQQAILAAGVANYVGQALANGYFANAGDGVFKFIDPNWGTAVLDETGQPLIFTRDEVLAAGADAAAGSAPRMFPGFGGR
jgi:hypothetical protein